MSIHLIRLVWTLIVWHDCYVPKTEKHWNTHVLLSTWQGGQTTDFVSCSVAGCDSSLRLPSDTFQASHSCLKVISLWEVARAQWQTKALFQIQFCAFSPKQWNTQFPSMLVWRAPERKWHAFVNKCLCVFAERRRFNSLCRSCCINLAGYPPKRALNQTCHIKIHFIAHLLNNAAWQQWERLPRHGNSDPTAFTLSGNKFLVWIITLQMRHAWY